MAKTTAQALADVEDILAAQNAEIANLTSQVNLLVEIIGDDPRNRRFRERRSRLGMGNAVNPLPESP